MPRKTRIKPSREKQREYESRYRLKDVDAYTARKREARSRSLERNPERFKEYNARSRSKMLPETKQARLTYFKQWRQRLFSYAEVSIDALRECLTDHQDNPFLIKKYKRRTQRPPEYKSRQYARRKERYATDPEFRKRVKAIQKTHRQTPKAKEYRRQYWRVWHKHRSATDPLYKLRYQLRRRLWDALDNKKWKRTSHTHVLLGADWNAVKEWIEKQFTSGMTWANYGKWHIDHIIPLASAENVQQLERLFHYTNLQPLWAIENKIKKDRIGWFPLGSNNGRLF